MTTPRGATLILAAALLWSTGGVCVKLLDGFSPMTISAGRSAVCTLVFLVILRGRLTVPRALWPGVALGAVCYAAVVTMFVVANRHTTAANVIILQYTAPLWIALHRWLIAGPRPRGPELAALVLGGAGVVLCTGGLSLFRDGRPLFEVLMGDGLAIVSGMALAGLMLTLRHLSHLTAQGRADATPSLLCILFGNVLATLAGATSLVADAGAAGLPAQAPLIGWVLIVWLGAGQLAGGYWLFQRGLRTAHALTASLLCLIEPVLNPVWVALFEGETPGGNTVFGGALVLMAVALALMARPEGETAKPPG